MQSKFRLGFFCWFILLNLILHHFQSVYAQYKSFRDTSTVMTLNPNFLPMPSYEFINRLIDRTYKSRAFINNNGASTGPYGDYSKWFTIDQGSPKKVVVAFIVNDSFQARFGGCYICIGDNAADPKALGNSCTSVFYDGGFIPINLPAGRYVFIYRAGAGGRYAQDPTTNDTSYVLAEIGLYSMPNLVGSASIISSYNPISTTYGSINLKINLDNRTHLRCCPKIDAGVKKASYSSSFVVSTTTFTGPYVLGVDHGSEKI